MPSVEDDRAVSAEIEGALGLATLGTGIEPPVAGTPSTTRRCRVDREPVKTQFGYHVIRLDEHKMPAQLPFDAVKDKQKQGWIAHVEPYFRRYDVLLTPTLATPRNAVFGLISPLPALSWAMPR